MNAANERPPPPDTTCTRLHRKDRSACWSPSCWRRARGDPGARRAGLPPAHHRQRQAHPDQVAAEGPSHDPRLASLGRERSLGARALSRCSCTVSREAAAADGSARPIADTSRIVSIGGDVTEILYALKAAPKIVAVDTTSTYPASALKEKKSVGYMRALSTRGRALHQSDASSSRPRTPGRPRSSRRSRPHRSPTSRCRTTPRPRASPQRSG